jgi:sulfite reductase (NADPH) flavoprotein alpha-component
LSFARRWLRRTPPRLGTLDCAVLALGHRRYADFCGFGRRLSHWLAQAGARSWFDRVDAHEGEDAALQRWREGLAQRWPALRELDAESGTEAIPAFGTWRLQSRRCLNPDSAAAGLFEIMLQPEPRPIGTWQPGDLFEVRVAHAAARRYSIASLPGDADVRLLVRRWTAANGDPGLASTQLCEQLAPTDTIDARIVSSPGFAPPESSREAILIANGVGVAPFLALLRQARTGPCWLIFGERDPVADAALIPELERARECGALARLDLAWSRASTPAYVQQRLREASDEVRAWLLDRGADLLVCGSPEMGAGIEAALLDMLGDDALEALREAGRYRRELF